MILSLNRKKGKKKFPVLFCVIMVLTAACAVIQWRLTVSVSFAETMNQTGAAFVRSVLSSLTGWIPFSVCEWLLLSVPAFLCLLALDIIHRVRKKKGVFLHLLRLVLGVAGAVFCLFVWTLSPGYHTEKITEKVPVGCAHYERIYDSLVDAIENGAEKCVKDEEVVKVLEILEEATEVAKSWKK